MIVVDPKVLEVLKLWRQFDGMEETVYEVRSLFMACSIRVSVSRISSYVCLYSPLYFYRINLLKLIKHNHVIMICAFGFVIWFGPSEF